MCVIRENKCVVTAKNVCLIKLCLSSWRSDTPNDADFIVQMTALISVRAFFDRILLLCSLARVFYDDFIIPYFSLVYNFQTQIGLHELWASFSASDSRNLNTNRFLRMIRGIVLIIVSDIKIDVQHIIS